NHVCLPSTGAEYTANDRLMTNTTNRYRGYNLTRFSVAALYKRRRYRKRDIVGGHSPPLQLKRPTTQILDLSRTVSLNTCRRNRHVRKTCRLSNNDGRDRTGHNCERSERTRTTGDLHKRCGAHSSAVLPNLPPSRFDCADVFTNV